MEKKRAERAATVDVNIETSPEVTPETEQAEHEAPDPENPFANFIPETEPLTAEQRDAEVKKLEDFFERKRIDPRAEWHAAPKPEPAAPADEVEAGFREFMDELRGVTHT